MRVAGGDLPNHEVPDEADAERPLTPPGNQQVPPPENNEAPVRRFPTQDNLCSRDHFAGPPPRPSRPRRDPPGSIIIPVGDRSSRRRASQDSAKTLSRESVRDRNAAMLFNELISDVCFVLGLERIPAHSYVLATGSSVFYAMFYGALPQFGDIPIPDVEPVAFKNLLKYLYTDAIDLDMETVLPTLYAAKKYLVTSLTRACIEFLETALNASNVCLLLSQSRLFEEEALMQRCWELIDAQTELCLKSEGFLDVDFKTLETILSRETLNVRETIVFDAAVAWGKAQCRRVNLDPEEASNIRKVLSRVFYQIRIPAMLVEEFANGPAQSGLLSFEETTKTFLWFTAKNKPEIPFPTRPRPGLSLMHCHRFQSSAYRSNQWRYRGRCDSIQFCADRRVFVAGFGLYGSSNGAADYKVLIELKRTGTTLASASGRFYSDGSSSVFPVLFEQPVQVEADVFYTASAVLDGAELSYFGQEGLSECQIGPTTFQFQCSTESTNGTGVQGGQIPEVLFFGPA